MQYLVDRYDKDHKISYPIGSREYYEVNNWVGRIPQFPPSICTC
jgi:hypothetical protein